MTPHLTFRYMLAFTLTPLLHVAAKSPPCIVYESSPYGFGSNILGLLLTMAANNETTRFYFDESAWKYKCKDTPGWSHLFSGSAPFPLLEGIPPSHECVKVQYEGSEFSGHDILKGEDPQKVFNLLRQSVQRLWRLSGRMRRKVDAQGAYLQSLPKPLIGIIIRAGDKALEDQLHGNRLADWYHERLWVENLKNLLLHNKFGLGGTCIIFSDDLTALYEGTKALKAQLNCMTIQMGGWEGGFRRTAWDDNTIFHSGNKKDAVDNYCRATIDLILELEALGTADVFTGSYNSNLPRLIHLLRFHVFGKAKQSAQDVLNDIEWHHDYRFHASPRRKPSHLEPTDWPTE